MLRATQVFTKVTETMSRANTPTLCWVLPMYAYMHRDLTKLIKRSGLSLALCEALAAGLEKLEVYFELAKASEHTIIATSKFFFVVACCVAHLKISLPPIPPIEMVQTTWRRPTRQRTLGVQKSVLTICQGDSSAQSRHTNSTRPPSLRLPF